ncbi:uncharacterized protein LOC144036950 [Vanacampus margaritifer]
MSNRCSRKFEGSRIFTGHAEMVRWEAFDEMTRICCRGQKCRFPSNRRLEEEPNGMRQKNSSTSQGSSDTQKFVELPDLVSGAKRILDQGQMVAQEGTATKQIWI